MNRRKNRRRPEGRQAIGERDRRPTVAAPPGVRFAHLTDAQPVKEYTRLGTFAVLFPYFTRIIPPRSTPTGHWKLQETRAPRRGLAPGRGARGSRPARNGNERPATELRS